MRGEQHCSSDDVPRWPCRPSRPRTTIRRWAGPASWPRRDASSGQICAPGGWRANGELRRGSNKVLGFRWLRYLAQLLSLAHRHGHGVFAAPCHHVPDHMAWCPRRSTAASTARPVPQFAQAVLHACRGLGGKNKARGHRETTESRASNQCRDSRSSGPCQ